MSEGDKTNLVIQKVTKQPNKNDTKHMGDTEANPMMVDLNRNISAITLKLNELKNLEMRISVK